MKTRSALLKVVAIGALLLGLPGSAAATGPTGAASLHTVLQSLALAEPAHCRRYWHTHRTCVRWRAGICRDWRVRRHRC
jgi:hypothetical protein